MEQSVSVKYDDFTFILNLTRRLDRFDVHDCKHNLSRNLHSWILLLIPRPAHGHDDYDDDYDDDDDGDDDGDDDDDDNACYRMQYQVTMGSLTTAAGLMAAETTIQGQKVDFLDSTEIFYFWQFFMMMQNI